LLEEVKEYLKVDGTDEDTEILGLIDAAEAYLTNAGVTKDETNELYKLAVKMLVVNWHENRQPIGKVDKLAFGLDSIITQLKYCYITDAI
jgi:uncharacterized phage protein (predicted DNA packaging)